MKLCLSTHNNQKSTGPAFNERLGIFDVTFTKMMIYTVVLKVLKVDTQQDTHKDPHHHIQR